jgi:hypothetical protein
MPGPTSRNTNGSATLSEIQLPYSIDELHSFTESRKEGLSKRSLNWIEKSSDTIWTVTKGTISQNSMEEIRRYVLQKYSSDCSYSKVVSFTKSFLRYLSKIRMDLRYKSFDLFLDKPRAVKERKTVTSRIITIGDIQNVLNHIKQAYNDGRIDRRRFSQYTTLTLFGAYTGQRSMATISKITVGQMRDALAQEKPCIHILPSQDKIKMEHYVPLHPHLIDPLSRICDGQKNDVPVFEYNSYSMWIKREKIPLQRCSGHFVLGDLRKFAEQYGDIIKWDHSNRAYILTHGVSGVDWSHYKHPLPEHVYEIYMEKWGKTKL